MIEAGGMSATMSRALPALPLPHGRSLSLERRPLVMGILNVTPDSFSDGGLHPSRDSAIAAALRMIEEGAEVIDIGGESTRPGAEPVSAHEEMDRVLPVVEGLRGRSDVAISVDTMKAEVAGRAIELGADIINDVTALRHDPAMRSVAARTGAAVVLMHMRGEPRTMQADLHYDDLIGEIARELESYRRDAIAAGIDPRRILVDPGIGFGKTFDHNLQILGATKTFAGIAPVVIGASRKGFIGHLTGQPAGEARTAGSLAAIAAAASGGATMVRVHDVRETVDFLKVFGAIREA